MRNLLYAKEALSLLEVNSSKIRIKVREKNTEFLIKYRLSMKDVEDIIYSLKEDNFIKRVEILDKKIDADFLYIFYSNLRIKNDFSLYELVGLYIKICVLKNSDILLIVSMHEKEF